MKVIKDLDELRSLASRDGGVDCYIRLNLGARSSKHIDWDGKFWYVYNEIDGTEQTLTDKELELNTNITDALSKSALILY